MKRQGINWEKIFVIGIADKYMCSKYTKHFQNSIVKITQFLNEWKMWIDISSKYTFGWQKHMNRYTILNN